MAGVADWSQQLTADGASNDPFARLSNTPKVGPWAGTPQRNHYRAFILRR